jgi:hypothetical protein
MNFIEENKNESINEHFIEEIKKERKCLNPQRWKLIPEDIKSQLIKFWWLDYSSDTKTFTCLICSKRKNYFI